MVARLQVGGPHPCLLSLSPPTTFPHHQNLDLPLCQQNMGVGAPTPFPSPPPCRSQLSHCTMGRSSPALGSISPLLPLSPPTTSPHHPKSGFAPLPADHGGAGTQPLALSTPNPSQLAHHARCRSPSAHGRIPHCLCVEKGSGSPMSPALVVPHHALPLHFLPQLLEGRSSPAEGIGRKHDYGCRWCGVSFGWCSWWGGMLAK